MMPVASAALELLIYFKKAGMAIAARMPMMATTIMSSTRVKPSFLILSFLNMFASFGGVGGARGGGWGGGWSFVWGLCRSAGEGWKVCGQIGEKKQVFCGFLVDVGLLGAILWCLSGSRRPPSVAARHLPPRGKNY